MIQPGLERIGRLLKGIHFPWKSIHVAGTNGKGSICSYASALLTRRLIRNGRFMSPHLVDRWDCITINDKPVSEREFVKVENHFKQLNKQEGINASEFELLTATAFELFNKNKVDVGVVEVGMGGRLDATNILNNQIVSVIAMIAREHQDFLGNTLEDIAHHKAGILRPKVPFIVNPMNEWNVHDVIDRYAEEIGAGPRIFPDTAALRRELFSTKDWHKFADPALPFQRDNAVLAYLAVIKVLENLHHSTKEVSSLLPHLKNKQIPGRLQSHNVGSVLTRHETLKILVDGAHNENAAEALKSYVYDKLQRKWTKDHKRPPKDGWPVTWVLAMSDGKDARKFVSRLLRPGDNVITTTFGPVDGMPWVKPMDPRELLQIALEAHENITGLYIPTKGAYRALCAAKYLSNTNPIVLTGSLYLVGDFLREKRAFTEDDPPDIKRIDQQERNRVNSFLSLKRKEQDVAVECSPSAIVTPTASKPESSVEAERRKLQEEINKLDREMHVLQEKENQLTRARLLDSDRFLSNAELNGPATSIPGFKIEQGQSSFKQKVFDDIEGIRKRLEGFAAVPSTALPQLEPTNDNTLREMVRNVPMRPTEESVLKGEVRPRIRAHYTDCHDEKPRHRMYRVPSSETVGQPKIRQVLSEDVEQPLVRRVHPLRLRFHEAEADGEAEEPLHNRQLHKGEKHQPSKAYLRRHYSNARPGWE